MQANPQTHPLFSVCDKFAAVIGVDNTWVRLAVFGLFLWFPRTTAITYWALHTVLASLKDPQPEPTPVTPPALPTPASAAPASHISTGSASDNT